MRYMLFDWDLQLFGEGGDGAGAAPGDAPAAEGQTGVNAPDAGEAPVNNRRPNRRQTLNVDYGRAPEQEQPAPQTAQQPQQEETAPKEETFEELIKGKYKEDYDKRVQDTISKRFKTADRDKQTLKSLTPVLELLASKHGVDLTDLNEDNLKKLVSAVEEDDTYYEDEAAERGMSVRSLKELKKVERENREIKRAEEAQRAEAENRAAFEKLRNEAAQAQQIYPGFNLEAELNNPAFMRLVKNGVDARTAFEVAHRDEILRSSMQYAAQTAAQKVSNAVQANAARPTENGIAAPAAPARTRVTDPRNLTPQMRKDIRNRVRRGEKIFW